MTMTWEGLILPTAPVESPNGFPPGFAAMGGAPPPTRPSPRLSGPGRLNSRPRLGYRAMHRGAWPDYRGR
jgi:hypothetical protein